MSKKTIATLKRLLQITISLSPISYIYYQSTYKLMIDIFSNAHTCVLQRPADSNRRLSVTEKHSNSDEYKQSFQRPFAKFL